MTSVIIKVPGGYIGLVEEVQGAFTQGASVEEVRKNLVEVVRLIIQTQREAAQKEVAEENHKEVRKESHRAKRAGAPALGNRQAYREADMSAVGRAGTVRGVLCGFIQRIGDKDPAVSDDGIGNFKVCRLKHM